MLPNRNLLFFFLLWLYPLLGNAQEIGQVEPEDNTAEEVVRAIVSAIEDGSSRRIAHHFGSNVDLYLPRAEGTFSRSQSEIIFKDFFAHCKPKSFLISYQGTSMDGTLFVIGMLSTEEGESYRGYLLLKNVAGSFVLQRIRFD